MRTRLLEWFDADARELPWRTAVRHPYPTLVAETMLQQTQVARVAPFYGAFLQAFPDVGRLAAADDADVLRAWQGLGYYRRARALQAAARVVVGEHGGRFPSDVAGLARLPGVGRYTAVAVAAQAFGVPGIAVDANVRRVGARVLALGVTGTSARSRDAAIEDGLARLLLRPEGGAVQRLAAVPEALIELGALVCTPRSPSCARCPLAPSCGALATGDGAHYGRPPARRVVRHEVSRALVAVAGDRVALVRRPPTGRWGGLWGFPGLVGEAPAQAREIAGVDHVLTHRRLRVTPVVAAGSHAPAGATWVALAELAAGGGPVPVATIDRKLARAVAAALAHAAGETTGATEGGPA